ncbi:hypothetical protein [Olleya marilimosa]|uniref:Lipoprotein n=1 Tax=Olleya marilimosa TaxID=272164 RepID=A0ABR8LZ56_9FLAO|nr:hypothetical protein [Olleya marilimosa]MBD3864708.1 hypothetical protein [Olleya marilimosa]
MKRILYISILLFTLMLISCKNYVISENDKVFESKLSDSELSSVSIDTNAIYKLYSTWKGKGNYEFDSPVKENFGIVNEIKNTNSTYSSTIEFVRINNNRKLNFYYLNNPEKISCEFLKADSGSIGIYDINNEVIYTKRVLGIGHSGKLIRGKALIKLDTLHLIEERVNHSKYVRIDCN